MEVERHRCRLEAQALATDRLRRTSAVDEREHRARRSSCMGRSSRAAAATCPPRRLRLKGELIEFDTVVMTASARSRVAPLVLVAAGVLAVLPIAPWRQSSAVERASETTADGSRLTGVYAYWVDYQPVFEGSSAASVTCLVAALVLALTG